MSTKAPLHSFHPPIGMAPLLLVDALPQAPSDGRFRVRLLSACGAAARPVRGAFYMRKEEDLESYHRKFSCSHA